MSKLITIILAVALPAIVFASSGGGHEVDMGELWKGFGQRVLVFAFLAVILFKLLKKPISNLLDQRTKDIEQSIKDAKEAQENARTELTKYEVELKEMESRFDSMKEQSLAAIEAEKNAIIDDANKQVEKLQKFAENLIESETRKSVEDIKREAVIAAIEAVEQKLGQELTPDKQKELLEKYIGKIGV